MRMSWTLPLSDSVPILMTRALPSGSGSDCRRCRRCMASWMSDAWAYCRQLDMSRMERQSVRDCKLAISLLNIILEDDSSYDVYFAKGAKIGEGRYVIRKYVNDSNIDRFLHRDICKRYRIESSKKNKDNKFPIIVRDELRIEKAWNLYCKLREYRLMTWWD